MNMMKLSLAALFLTGAMGAGAEHLGSVDKTLIDSTYTPGEDFDRYVNNGWMKAHPLTDEYAR